MSNETEKKESVAPDRDRSDRRLHRLYDGDLSAEEKAALEQELAANPALGAKLEGLREIGVVVRAARTDDAPIDSEALWNGIEAKIAVWSSKPRARVLIWPRRSRNSLASCSNSASVRLNGSLAFIAIATIGTTV